MKKEAAIDVSYEDEDFNVSDYCGGNYDDAYSMGIDHGYVMLARHLLEKYAVPD